MKARPLPQVFSSASPSVQAQYLSQLERREVRRAGQDNRTVGNVYLEIPKFLLTDDWCLVPVQVWVVTFQLVRTREIVHIVQAGVLSQAGGYTEDKDQDTANTNNWLSLSLSLLLLVLALKYYTGTSSISELQISGSFLVVRPVKIFVLIFLGEETGH